MKTPSRFPIPLYKLEFPLLEDAVRGGFTNKWAKTAEAVAQATLIPFILIGIFEAAINAVRFTLNVGIVSLNAVHRLSQYVYPGD